MSPSSQAVSVFAAISTILLSAPPALAQNVVDNRPVIKLETGGSPHQSLSDSLFNRLSVVLSELNRFEILEQSTLSDTEQQEDVPAAKKPTLVFVYAIDDVKAEQSSSSYNGKTTTTSTETLLGHLRVINVATGLIHKQLPLRAVGSSTDGSQKAHEGAVELFISDFRRNVREAFKLEAQIIAQSGRTVKLNAGTDSGVTEGEFFEVVRYGLPTIDPTTGDVLGVETHGVGQVLISKAYPKYAEAYVVKGTFGIKEKDQVRELPSVRNFRADFTGAAELTPVSYVDGTGTTTSVLSVMPRLVMSGSTLLPRLGIETGTVLSVGATGFGPSVFALSGDAGLMASFQVIPEFVSVYGTGGIGAMFAGQPSTAGQSVSALNLNVFTGAGARAHLLGGLSAFGEARYRLGNTLNNWSYFDKGSDKSINVPNSSVGYPSVSWGGLSYQAGLSYAF